MDSPLISIALSCENEPRALELFVRSLQKQSYQNWECICVCDANLETTETAATNDSRFTVLHCPTESHTAKTHMAMAKQWNTGLAATKGSFFIVVDGNYYFRSDCLQRYVKAALASPNASLIYSNVQQVRRYADSSIVMGAVRTSGPFDLNKALYRNFFPLPTMFRRELIDKGLRFRNVISPEREFFTQALGHNAESTYIGEPLVFFHAPDSNQINRNDFFDLPSLAQTICYTPQLYPPDMVSWANEISTQLSNPKEQTSIVIVTEIAPTSQNCVINSLAQNLATRGHLVTLMIPVTSMTMGTSTISTINGVQILPLPQLTPQAVSQYIGRLGDNIVLLSHNSTAPAIITRGCPNVMARGIFLSEIPNETPSDALKHINFAICPDSLVSKTSEWTGIPSGQCIGISASATLEHFDAMALTSSERTCTHDSAEAISWLTHINTTKPICSKSVSLASALSWYTNIRHSLFAQKRKAHHDTLKQLYETPQKTSSVNNSLINKRTSNPDFSVIIPCRNVDIARLRRNIVSLRLQTDFNNINIEIIISDYASNEAQASELKKLGLEFSCVIVRSDTQGPWSRSAALNRGIRAASAPWVITTDADMIFSSNFFIMVHRAVSLFGKKTIYYAQPVKLAPVSFPTEWSNDYFDEYAAKGRLFGEQGRGGCQVASRSWLHSVKAFNETYLVWGNEDDDMFERAGWDGRQRVWLTPGRYLHQWHMPNIYQAARDENRSQYEQLINNPRIVVNDESWGRERPDTKTLISKNPPRPERPIVELQSEIIALENNKKAQSLQLAQHGRLALQNGQIDAALELLEDSRFLADDDPSVFLSLAEVYIKIGLIEYAVVNVDRALVLAPNFEPANKARELLRTV